MKAFLLAAGLGTRLRPLTNDKPKCLVTICGKSLLEIWLEQLDKYGVEEVLINTHHFVEQIDDFIKKYQGKLNVTLTYETTLLGSGGTILENRTFVDQEESFWVLYSDNLSSANLHKIADFHGKHDGIVTVGLFKPEHPSECGIAVLDKSGKILDFEEKPQKPKNDLANAGIYLIRSTIFEKISWDIPKPIDFGYHLMPQLKCKMYGLELEGYHLDIGTLTKYEQAQRECPRDLIGL